MYPNIIIAHNIGMASLVGKLILEGFSHLNPDQTDTLYDQGKMFIENYLCDEYSYTGKLYFNLPDFEHLLVEAEELMSA